MDKKINYSQREEGYPVISKKDLKCIWMTAGFISYKLCKYDFQCEKCPLDWELRNLSCAPYHPEISRIQTGDESHFKAGLENNKEELALFNIRESLFYHPGHIWIKVEKTDEVRIGIDCFLGSLLKKVKVIILPLSGRRGIQGENLCSIIQEEGIIYVNFPISGLILSVNQKLKDQPDLIHKDPLGDGFLLTLKPRNFQRDQKYLFSGEEAFSWCRREWERFKDTIISEFPSKPGELGITMQDGGMTLGDIKGFIDPGRYIQLVNHFLRKGEKISVQPMKTK